MSIWLRRTNLECGVLVFIVALTLGCSNTNLDCYHPVARQPETSEKVDESPNSAADANPTNSASALASTDSPDSTHQQEPDGTSTGETFAVSALVPANVIDGSNVGHLLKVARPEPTSAAAESQKDMTIEKTSATAIGASQNPSGVTILIPEKSFQMDGQSKAWRVSFDDLDLLKVLNMQLVGTDAVDQMPKWLKSLNGQRIKLRGFMYPTYESEGINRFVLARDNQICCFGRDPKVYDLVQVDLKPGTSTNYIPPTRSFDVVGKFKIEMMEDDGKPMGLYSIEEAQVLAR